MLARRRAGTRSPRPGFNGTADVPKYETSVSRHEYGMTERLDAIIIGTGQAAKPLARALAGAGWKTAIIEKGRVGGTCVIEGCTPTKTMIASARVAYLARRAAEYGVHVGGVEVDPSAVPQRKKEVVDMFSSGSERGMQHHETLELIFGETRFVRELEVEVRLSDVGTRRQAADRIFINAGARPRVPRIPDSMPCRTSTRLRSWSSMRCPSTWSCSAAASSASSSRRCSAASGPRSPLWSGPSRSPAGRTRT
jgi:pyruvate/2-oxoglutarate dehydrogenase complex dihydrolipoamide dehydrogenase (E3) component